MSPLDIVLSGILVMGLVAIIVSIRDERESKKYHEKGKDKLEMIEEALKILAEKDQDVREALRQAGFYKK